MSRPARKDVEKNAPPERATSRDATGTAFCSLELKPPTAYGEACQPWPPPDRGPRPAESGPRPLNIDGTAEKKSLHALEIAVIKGQTIHDFFACGLEG